MSPWASFATRLHLETPLENIKKIIKYPFSNIELILTHTVLELDVLGIVGKLLVAYVTLLKEIQKKFNIYCLGAAQNPINHIRIKV